MSKYEHLIPPPVKDMIERLQEPMRDNERLALIQRLEVTRDIIIRTLELEARKKR